MVIRKFRAVVENGDGKIELLRQRGDGLGDMAGTGNPEFHGWGDGFFIKPMGGMERMRSMGGGDGDGKILFYTPTDSPGYGGEFVPEFGGGGGVGKNQAADAAAADEAVVPAEIVIEDHVKFGGLAGFQGLERAGLHLGLQAAAAEGADDFAVREKNGLGPGALRAGALGAGNQRQRERAVRRHHRGGSELLVNIFMPGHAK